MIEEVDYLSKSSRSNYVFTNLWLSVMLEILLHKKESQHNHGEMLAKINF